MATGRRRGEDGIFRRNINMYPRIIDTVLLVTVFCVTMVTPESQEVCVGGTFRARCGPDEVIVMDTAQYGRMEVGKCIRKEQQHMGCTNEVLSLVDRWCSGRRHCQTTIPNDELATANNACLDFLQLYFKATYHCLKVFAEDPSKCKMVSHVTLPARHGFISSQVTDETGCVSLKAPGLIQANSGEKIKFTLLDFATNNMKRSAGPIYGYIMDKSVQKNKTIYGGGRRTQEVYTSESAVVEIALANREERHQEGDFLLQYEVVGCADLDTPAEAWYKRSRDNATIGCKDSAQKWHLRCEGNKWIGTIGNCSVTAIGASTEEEDKGIWAFMFYIIPGAAALVVLLVVFVVVGCVCHKKKRIKDESRRNIQTPNSPMRSGASTSARKPAGKYKAMECTGSEDLVYNVNARHHALKFTKDGISQTCQRNSPRPIPGSALAQVMMLTQPEPAYPTSADLMDLGIPSPSDGDSTVVAMDASVSSLGPPPLPPDCPPPEPPQAKYEIVQLKIRPKSIYKDGDPHGCPLITNHPEPPTPSTPPLPTRKEPLSLVSSSDSSPVDNPDEDSIYVNESVAKNKAPTNGSHSNKGSPMIPRRPPRKCDDEKRTPCTPSPGHLPLVAAAEALTSMLCNEPPPAVEPAPPAASMSDDTTDDLPPPPPPPDSEDYYNIDELTGVPKEDPTIPILPDPPVPPPAPPLESYYSNDPEFQPLATKTPSPPGDCGECYYNNCDCCSGDKCQTSVKV